MVRHPSAVPDSLRDDAGGHKIPFRTLVGLMDRELANKTISGIGYNSIAKTANYLLRVGSGIILAQILNPHDYGVFGFAMVIIGFLGRFNDLGLGGAVVQRLELDQKTLTTAFTLKFFLALAICAFCVALGPLIALFSDHPEVGRVIQVSSIFLVISCFSFVQDTHLTRDLHYRKLSAANIISSIIRSGTAILLVLLGLQYWSLVWAEIAGIAALVAILNYFYPAKIRFGLDREAARGLLSFGWKLLVSGLLGFLIFSVDKLMIGSISGLTVLGFYALAFNWASVGCSILSDTMNGVLFPAFAKIQTNRGELKRAYLKVLQYVSTGGILVNLILLTSAQEIFFFVLGRGTDKWAPAIPAFQILCLYGMVRTILDPVGNVVLAMGKPGIILRATILVCALEMALLYFALVHGGIVLVAVLVTLAYAAQFYFYGPFLKRECGIQASEIMEVLRAPVICGILIGSATMLLGFGVGFSFLSMTVKVLFCLAGYFLMHGWITRWTMMREVKGLLANGFLIKVRRWNGKELQELPPPPLKL